MLENYFVHVNYVSDYGDTVPQRYRSFSWACMAANSYKILNVAEKNDAAKAISNIMAGGRARRVSMIMHEAAASTITNCMISFCFN